MFGAVRRNCKVLQALVLVLGLGWILSAHAQDAEGKLFDFDIQAKPLSQALVDFSRATGRQVAADSDAIRGVDGNAVGGRKTARAALRQMVAGTGLELVTVNDRSFALRRGQVAAPGSALEGILADPSIDEIVVRGQLLDRSLQDTHASVSVLGGEELEQGINRDLYDVIERLPNVSMEPGGFGFVIRGVKTQGQNLSGGNAISYKIDGVTVNDFQAIRQGPASVWDLEQVEILRGPQSTQQGQNALAGAIIMRSKDPVDGFEAKARVDIGSFDESRFAGALNVPLAEGWAFRLSAEDYGNDGDIQHYITGEEIGDGALQTYRAKLRYNNDDDFDAILSYGYTDNFLAAQSILPDEWPERRVNTHRQDRWAETDTVSLLIKYDLSERWALESETARIETDWFAEQIGDPSNPNPFSQMTFIGGRFSEGVTQELKLYYDGDSIRWVSGLYFADHDAESGSTRSTTDPLVFTETVKSTNKAVFSELEFDFNDKWTGVFGLRYDNEDREFRSPTTGNEHSTNEPLPKAGLVYSFEEDKSVGLTVQRAYRAGGAFLDFGTGDVLTFEPEFTTNYEFSYRSLNFDGRLTFNANVFYTEYTDMQLFSFVFDFQTFTGNARVDNVGEASLYGGEIETVYEATDKLSLFLNVGYTGTEIEEDVQSVGAVTGESNQGNEFPLVPAWTGSFGGQYSIADNWNIQLSGSFTDEFYYSERNLPEELNPSYFLVDGEITYFRDNWSIGLYGRNLLDKQYLTRTRADGFSSAGDSRFIGVSLNVNF